MIEGGPSIHASAVLVGEQAILIRGPSGSGKSRLAFDLIVAGRAGQIPSTILIGDDRIDLKRTGNRIIACSIPELGGLIEIRGLGIRRCGFAQEGNIGLIVDLAASDAERYPPCHALYANIEGIKIPRIPVGSHYPAMPLVEAALLTTPG